MRGSRKRIAEVLTDGLCESPPLQPTGINLKRSLGSRCLGSRLTGWSGPRTLLRVSPVWTAGLGHVAGALTFRGTRV